jgi:class 3 adenylate cyclase
MVGEFAFVRVDVIGHSRISRENPSSTVDRILSDFEHHVESIAAAHKGRIWNWAGDGGLIVFYEGRQTEKVGDALTAARTLLDSLGEFNYEHPFDQPEHSLRLRIAIHCGTARYRSSTGRIHSAAINYVAHLEHERTHPNSISISEPVYRELSRGARQQFVSAGTFEDVPIYTTAVEKGQDSLAAQPNGAR